MMSLCHKGRKICLCFICRHSTIKKPPNKSLKMEADQCNTDVIDVESKYPVINLDYLPDLNDDEEEMRQSLLRETTVIVSPKDDDVFFIEKISLHNSKHSPIHILNNTKIVIGRLADADVQICSPSISRNHAIMTKGDNGWSIKDTKSTNGVSVNGIKIDPDKDYPLHVGDIFTLGPPSDLEYQYILKQRMPDIRTKATSSLSMSPPRKILKSDSQGSRTQLVNNEDNGDMELKRRLLELEKQLKDKEEIERLLNIKLEEQEKEHEEKLKREREMILKQKAEDDKQMRERLEEAYRQHEQQLRFSLAAQKQSLLDEKNRVEKSLLQQMNDRDKEIQEKLQQEKKHLEKELAASEIKATLLENKLTETKGLKEKARVEILNEFSDLMETEMNCSICSELFVIAITLGCSHTFCKECITTWKRKKRDCPICRKQIKSEARALVIDNFIDKMVESLPPEMKLHRENLVKERERNAKATQATVAQENVAANNINYLGMWNARANEPTVVINRLGIATGMPMVPNQRARNLLDYPQPINMGQQSRNIPNVYPNEAIPTTRPAYVFSNAPNTHSHSIQIDANTIVRVVGNLRMPINPPESRVHLERLVPGTMGVYGNHGPPQNTGTVPVIQIPQNNQARGRTSVLNLAPVVRNMAAPPGRPPIEPIIISDSEDDPHQMPNRARNLQANNHRARYGRGQNQRN